MREIKFRAWCTAKNVMLQRSTVSRAFVDTNHALSDKAREENYIFLVGHISSNYKLLGLRAASAFEHHGSSHKDLGDSL